MDSLFHFVFVIVAALAARVHIKHPMKNIMIAAFLSVAIDVDHIIGLSRGTLHNVFVLILLPLIFVIYIFSKRKMYQAKGLSILILVFLASHLFLDMFTGGVALLYPLSNDIYGIAFDVPIAWSNASGQTYEGMLVSSLGIGILFFFAIIILPCIFLDKIIGLMEERHENFRRALKDLTKWKYKY